MPAALPCLSSEAMPSFRHHHGPWGLAVVSPNRRHYYTDGVADQRLPLPQACIFVRCLGRPIFLPVMGLLCGFRFHLSLSVSLSKSSRLLPPPSLLSYPFFSHLHSHTSRPSRGRLSPRTCLFQPLHLSSLIRPSCLCHISKRPPTGSRLAIDAGGGLLLLCCWVAYCRCPTLFFCSCSFLVPPQRLLLLPKGDILASTDLLLSLTGCDTSSSLLFTLPTTLLPFGFRLPFPGPVRGLRVLLYTYFLACCARAEHLCSNLLQLSLFTVTSRLRTHFCSCVVYFAHSLP